MIYFKTSDDKHVVILEPGNVRRLMLGVHAISPDSEIAIAYTPDAVWTEEELQKIWASGVSLKPEEFKRILAEGMKRKVVDR